MRRYRIEKSNNLRGEININGAKNAALPILMASTLARGKVILKNIPVSLNDVNAIIEIIKRIGSNIEVSNHRVRVETPELKNAFVPEKIANKTRYSMLLLGLLLSRFKKVKIPFPGGCSFAKTRPIDIHLDGFERLGTLFNIREEFIEAKTDGLKGNDIALRFPSVGATENLMIGASLAEGETTINNAAREPEIVDLAMFLNKMGANIKGAGTSKIIIQRANEFSGCKYTIIPDRIEIGTFIAVAAITESRLIIRPIIFKHIESTVKAFSKIGVKFSMKDNSLEVDGTGNLNPVKLKIGVFPELATDMQPIFTSVLTLVKDRSEILETVYPSRFTHVDELKKMGADIKIKGQRIIINGVNTLKGANIYANDLRAGAALLVAGLAADGVTKISNVYQIERGYENIVAKLRNIGAKIEIVNILTPEL